MTNGVVFDVVDAVISEFCDLHNVSPLPVGMAALRHACDDIETKCDIEPDEDIISLSADIDQNSGVLTLTIFTDMPVTLMCSAGGPDILGMCSGFSVEPSKEFDTILKIRFSNIFNLSQR